MVSSARRTLTVRVDSNTQGTGGLAAEALGDIFVRELAEDLQLIDPISFQTVQASVVSTAGDVQLEAQDGSLLDESLELYRPSTQIDVDNLDPLVQEFLDDGFTSGKWTADAIAYPVSPGLYSFLYPHQSFLGGAHRNRRFPNYPT